MKPSRMENLRILSAVLILLSVSAAHAGGKKPLPTCSGVIDCFMAKSICTLSSNLVVYGSATFQDAPNLVTSDGKGAYSNSTDNVYAVRVNHEVEMLFRKLRKNETAVRTLAFDLNHPVDGDIGVPLGVITDGNDIGLYVQWYTDANLVVHNLSEMAIGITQFASLLSFGFHVNGRYHVIQVGPDPAGHCHSPATAIYGNGTSQATIYRESSTKWVIDLPAGSIGRLFDIYNTPQYAVNKGLYYMSLHFVIGQ